MKKKKSINIPIKESNIELLCANTLKKKMDFKY